MQFSHMKQPILQLSSTYSCVSRPYFMILEALTSILNDICRFFQRRLACVIVRPWDLHWNCKIHRNLWQLAGLLSMCTVAVHCGSAEAWKTGPITLKGQVSFFFDIFKCWLFEVNCLLVHFPGLCLEIKGRFGVCCPTFGIPKFLIFPCFL